MDKIINFHLEFLISFGILYGFYLLFLRKETFFAISRFYLLAILILSAGISLANFKMENDSFSDYRIISSIDYSPQIEFDKLQAPNSIANNESVSKIDYPSVILFVYLIGTLIMFTNLIRKHIKINKFLKSCIISENNTNGIRIVHSDREISPFSYFNTICLPSGINDNAEKGQIITHEIAHIKLGHSFDILYYEIFRAIFWFNPLMYLFGKSIKDIHEFEADKITLNSGFEKASYMNLVLNLNMGEIFVSLANNFNQSTTLKRFKMMNAKKSQPKKVAKILYLIPILGILIYQFSCTPAKDLKLQGTYPESKCTVRPVTIGGYAYKEEYLEKNTISTPQAKKANINASIIVSYNVYEDGTIHDVVSITGRKYPGKWEDRVGYGLDEKAEEIIKGLPKYKPGEVNGEKVKVNYRISLFFGDKKVLESFDIPDYVGVPDKNSNIIFIASFPEKNKGFFDDQESAVFDIDKAMKILKSLTYTEAAKSSKIEGEILVNVVVDSKGKIISVKIEKGLGYGLDEEIIKAFNNLNTMNPPIDKNGTLLKEKKLKIPIFFTSDKEWINFPEKKLGDIRIKNL